mgnify:CR=1 FL=1
MTLEVFAKAVHALFSRVHQYMFVPGHVENIVLMIDTGNKGALDIDKEVNS